MIDWRDPRQRQAALAPTNQPPPDDDIHCYRPDGSPYVAVSRSEWRRLRKPGKLDSALNEARERGPIEANGR